MIGFVNENLILAKLEQKCDLKRDPAFDHQYKLDFIISGFKLIHKLTLIGVQVTTNPDDSVKQRVFFTERKKKTLVDRSLYIKVHPEVDIDSYGAELIYNALVAYAFQTDLQDKDVLGVHIRQDVCYEFFDLATDQLVLSERHAALGKNEFVTLRGRIMKYFRDQGYGFIEADQKRWFFHISVINDEFLKENVLPQAIIQPDIGALQDPIEVLFEDGGFTRKNASKPTARNVRRVSADSQPQNI